MANRFTASACIGLFESRFSRFQQLQINLVIGREVGALAEMSKKLHILRERIERVALFSLGKKN